MSWAHSDCTESEALSWRPAQVRCWGTDDVIDLQLGRVVVTDRGVYRPPPLKTELGLFVLTALIVLVSMAIGRASVAFVWSSLTLLAILVASRIVVYRRHGRLGRPTLSLRGGELSFALPQDSRGQAVLATAEFRQVIVYGRAGERVFRFIRQNGAYVEVSPAWGPRIECVAIEFLQRRLPPSLRVTVEEPQTLFASIRGDGPEPSPSSDN